MAKLFQHELNIYSQDYLLHDKSIKNAAVCSAIKSEISGKRKTTTAAAAALRKEKIAQFTSH